MLRKPLLVLMLTAFASNEAYAIDEAFIGTKEFCYTRNNGRIVFGALGVLGVGGAAALTTLSAGKNVENVDVPETSPAPVISATATPEEQFAALSTTMQKIGEFSEAIDQVSADAAEAKTDEKQKNALSWGAAGLAVFGGVMNFISFEYGSSLNTYCGEDNPPTEGGEPPPTGGTNPTGTTNPPGTTPPGTNPSRRIGRGVTVPMFAVSGRFR